VRRGLLAVAACLAALPAFAAQVSVKPFKEVALYPERTAQAQVVSLNDAKLAAEISARIAVLPVQVGQRVARGAVLARLDCTDHEIALREAEARAESARARLKLAEQQLTRSHELAQANFISGDALDIRATEVSVVRADTQSAEARLDAARRDVAKCTIRAPFPAIVSERLGQVGELAAPGSPVVALLDVSRIEVSAQVQTQDATSLKAARKILFVSQNESHALKLLRISSALSPSARTREARLGFAAKHAAPGSSGEIRWQDARAHLPAELLVMRGGKPGVFTLRDGRARFVALPEAVEGRPAMTSLPADTAVVVRGHLPLREGETAAATAGK
jgi:RND family efflux transporter MFP subunit